MPKTAYAVIGAGYGDEGKGLATDFLARHLYKNNRVTVVRSNGGAQAGHSVVSPSGERHVFHHVGSGSMANARTHLSQFFVAHPMMLQRELRDLEELGFYPDITIDPRAPVTTPYDVLINQILEHARSNGRHGSCGMGFGETIERHENGPRLVAADLFEKGLVPKLEKIAQEWLPDRLRALGVEPTLPAHLDALDHLDGIEDHYIEDCIEFTTSVRLMKDAELSFSDEVIFEGAQGLALDMDLGEMPHVTRSRTGLPNMIQIAKEAGIKQINALYMTRAYATRHGAGPFPPEDASKADFIALNDPTNVPNDWQGSLRVGPLDIDFLARFVKADLERSKGKAVTVRPGMGVTCLDQLAPEAEILQGGKIAIIDRDIIPQEIFHAAGLPITMVSEGPSSEDARFA
jgi:adenylosuccinate synthase